MKKASRNNLSETLSRGVEEVVVRRHLEERLLKGDKLRVKHGIDPTGPHIHIGRAVSLWKLRKFQELGHTVVLVVGDFTAEIGDASDKTAKRQPLTRRQVRENMVTYKEQIGKILDMTRAELRYNSEWLSKLTQRELVRLATQFTAQQLIHRRNFEERWSRQNEIGLHELLYPLYQGYDSVAVHADLEIGGSDQLFNLLAGRKIQELCGQSPQDILTTKMLMGLDGRKMSTTWGNTIAIGEAPQNMFGKVMSMRDEAIKEYFLLATSTVPLAETQEIEAAIAKGKTNPRDAKMRLAREIVKLYHGGAASRRAEGDFVKVFQKRSTPQEMPDMALPAGAVQDILEILIRSGAVRSRSEAKRLVSQGGVEVSGKVWRDWRAPFSPEDGAVLRVGKKAFFRIKKL